MPSRSPTARPTSSRGARGGWGAPAEAAPPASLRSGRPQPAGRADHEPVALNAQALAGAATAGRSTRQSGTVASTTSATMVSVVGTPARSLTKPQIVGAIAEAAIVTV